MEGGWSVPPLLRIERCLLCPCGAGSCRLKTSLTPTNPGRRFYKCPVPEQCRFGKPGFFKWADCVKASELIDVPYCGGCMAGPCRVRQEMKGPNAGRILFTCTIMEGQGSCGYRVFQDELEMSLRAQVNSTINSPPMTSTNCTDNPPPNIGLSEENIPINNLQKDQSSVISSSSPCPKSRRTPSRKTKQSKLQEDKPDELLRSPLKRLLNGNQGFSLLLDPLVMVHEQENSDASTTLMLDSIDVQDDNRVNTGSSATITTSPISVCNAEPENGAKPFTVNRHVPLRDEPSEKNKVNCVLSDSVSKAFRFAAEQLQNDLFTVLENTDSKDHETMKLAAETTFSALDHLGIDHQNLKKRVNEFISYSISLAAIEQSIVRNDSYQELELQCKFERLKLDEMKSAHTKAVDNVMRSRKSLEVLQDVICSAKEWLFEVEAEYLCSELELKDMEVQLVKNFAEKQVLEVKYLIASKELEDSTKLHKKLEAAKAEFDRAKVLLRG